VFILQLLGRQQHIQHFTGILVYIIHTLHCLLVQPIARPHQHNANDERCERKRYEKVSHKDIQRHHQHAHEACQIIAVVGVEKEEPLRQSREDGKCRPDGYQETDRVIQAHVGLLQMSLPGFWLAL
jgi:hypothetical protein